MTPGASGWDVAALQFLLGERGFAPGALDGGFGPATAAAVQRYQAAVGLSADGVAGTATLAALRRPPGHRDRREPGRPGPLSAPGGGLVDRRVRLGRRPQPHRPGLP